MGIEEVLQDARSHAGVQRNGVESQSEEPALGAELAALLDVAELQRCLSKDLPKFETEGAYHSYLHLKFTLRTLRESLLDSIAGRLTGNSILNSNATSGEESLQNLEILKSLADKVDAAGKERLAWNSEWKPRIERLADKYDLEGLERELFACSFVMQGLKPLPSGSKGSRMQEGGVSVLRKVGMTAFEYEAMMDKDRLHVKEGCFLAVLDYRMAGLGYGSAASFSKEALQMLMLGNKLPSTSALTLSTTKMMEVLEEEKAHDGKARGGEKPEEGKGTESEAASWTTVGTSDDIADGSRVGDAEERGESRSAEVERDLGKLGLTGEAEEDDVSRRTGAVPGQAAFGGLVADSGGSAVPSDLAGTLLAGITGRNMGGLPVGMQFPSMGSLPGIGEEGDTSGLPKRKDEAAPLEITDILGELRGMKDAPQLIGGEELLPGSRKGPAAKDDKEKNESPYKSNMEYLEDRFQLLALQIQLSQTRSGKNINEALGMAADQYYGEDYFGGGGGAARNREMEAKQRMVSAKIKTRLAKAGTWRPRLLALSEKLGLDQFEEDVVTLLVGFTISPVLKSIMVSGGYNDMTVYQILNTFCESFEEQVSRRVYFYKGAKLVQSGVLKLGEISRGWGSDLVSTPVEVDRRTLDFVVGLDTELNELVEGSHLYTPTITLDRVVLPPEQKDMVLKTLSSFESYAEKRAEYGLEDTISYGAGLVILFCGPSGTGKTMTVNALAHHLKKRVLLVNLPSLGASQGDLNFKWLFREAKVNDAVLFFDECESVFETREHGSKQVNVLLTEMERHRGIVFLATNRPYDLDEAMHRRITLVVEFHPPDHLLRVDIWKSLLPPKLPLAEGIDLKKIALKYELTGGFIKNAIISSLLLAIGRSVDPLVVTEHDLMEGCRLQLRGSLRMKAFDRRVVPKSGLDALVVSESLEKQLQEIAHFDKARQILFGQWGFSEQMRERQGISCLFHGLPGTGKTMAAECLGFEMGKPIKFVNCAELVNKYVGETGKNIEKVFEEAKVLDALLVFDEAEGLFGSRHAGDQGSSARYANMDVGLLLHHLERFPGALVLITNTIDNIDKAFFRRIKFVLEFESPDAKLRAKLWKSMIPDKVPVEGTLDYDLLGQRFEYAGGSIASAVFRASARAALRVDGSMKLKMDDLLMAAEEETKKSGENGTKHKSMFM